MANKSTIVSYVLAALSGVCFVTGVALLSNEGSAVNHEACKKNNLSY